MDSSLDIFGRAVGLAYMVCAPMAAYFLLRTRAPLRTRDITLGVFGFIEIIFLAGTPVTNAAFVLAARILAKWQSPPSEFASTFVYKFCFYGAFALVNEATRFLLLKYFASRQRGPGPGFAYAVGAAGAYCLMLANSEFHYLQVALTEFGQDFPLFDFGYGIPKGARAVSLLLIEVILTSFVWRGIEEKRPSLIGGAVILDIALAAILSLLIALMPKFPYFIFDSLFGLVIALSYFWVPPILRLWGRFSLWREGKPATAEGEGAGLLTTWRHQRWRSD